MMLPFDDQEAARVVQQAGPEGPDAALRAYTANLYASNVWLQGSGSFFGTVKTERTSVFGEEEVMLACRARHGDVITPAHVTCYDQALLHRTAEAKLGAEERRQALSRSRIRSAAGSADELHPDAWLHTVVGRKWVDFVHAGSGFASLMRNSVSTLAGSLNDPRLLPVRFDADPHRLGTMLHNAVSHKPEVNAALLARRGVLVWGDDPKKVYQRMNELLRHLDALESRYIELPSVTDHRSEELNDARRRFAQSLRGSMMRIGCGPQLAAWRHGPELQAVLRNPDVLQTAHNAWLVDQPDTAMGPPLVLHELAGLNPEALASDLDSALRAARREHDHEGDELWPNVLLIPDLGLVALAPDRAGAERRAAAWAHTLRAISTAQALHVFQAGEERPASLAEVGGDAPADKPLSGQIALVTSVGSGIGNATARAMLAAGAHVALCERDERVLEAVGEQPLERYGDRVLLVLCDLRDDEQCLRAVETTSDAFGGLDILVSNAGTSASGPIFGDSGHKALDHSLDANLLAHQRIARHAATAMLQQRGGGGALLFNAAKSAFHQGPGFGPYAVAKAALVSLMRQYAIDLGRYGIRANAVNADRIRTNLISDGVLDGGPSARDLSPSMYFRTNLLRREATPELVADAFVYLASAQATTGCVITVDGGNPAAFPR